MVFRIGLAAAAVIVLDGAPASGQAATQTSRSQSRPDPAVVSSYIDRTRQALREVHAGLRRLQALDAVKQGGRETTALRSDLDAAIDDFRQLDQRLARVQSSAVFKAGDSKDAAPRDFGPVKLELERIGEDLVKACTRVAKIDAFVVKQKTIEWQPVNAEIGRLRPATDGAQGAMKKVLFGAAGVTGGLPN